MEVIIDDPGDNKSQMFAKIAFSVAGACAVGVTLGAIPFVTPALRRHCLPYIPATDSQIENVLKALRLCSMQKPIKAVLDVGSGDGRIVMAAARNGYQASGVEINRWLVWYSRYKALRSGLRGKTNFFVKDMWKTDLSAYDAVVVFGTENLMDDLSKKLEKEMTKQSAVIACRFDIGRWTPAVTVGSGIDTVWVYSMPDHATKFLFPLIKDDIKCRTISATKEKAIVSSDMLRQKVVQ